MDDKKRKADVAVGDADNSEKAAPAKKKGSTNKQPKKKWLVKDVWSVHIDNGREYYYNHVRICISLFAARV
jgi:hypothetical protein